MFSPALFISALVSSPLSRLNKGKKACFSVNNNKNRTIELIDKKLHMKG